MHLPTLIIGASAVAVISSSTTLLIAMSSHDLIRSVAVVALICGAITIHHVLMDRRMARMEAITARVARAEHDVLNVLHGERHLN